jgi:integrase-like protein
MSVFFNHGIRYEICDRNPIQVVRQSAKRKAVPVILSAHDVQGLIAVLGIRERTLVLLAFGTGLRMSELFGLKWQDIDFRRNQISVTRSIVFQVVGPCKTEASQKPVPLDSRLAEALKVWRDHTKYSKLDDWVFASPAARGKRPYGGSASCGRSSAQLQPRSGSHSVSGGTRSKAHVFFIVESEQNGHQSNARIAPSRLQPSDIGYVYPGGYSTKKTSPEQRRSSSAGMYNSCGLTPASRGSVPSLCLLQVARSPRKHWFFNDMILR